MRRCYLVCYDIRDPKRWRQVFKIMKGHGEHWQLSVFFCVLKAIDRVRMQTQLEEAMNLKEDQTMIIDLGSDEDLARQAATVLGPSLPRADRGMVVV
jgi:CRISPR-associated protein Cas2